MFIVLKSGFVFYSNLVLYFNENVFNEILFYVKLVDIFIILFMYGILFL